MKDKGERKKEAKGLHKNRTDDQKHNADRSYVHYFGSFLS